MVAIISHDSGGAEILSSWVLEQNESFCLVLDGPAKKIFSRKIENCLSHTVLLEEALEKADWFLCGTSWQSDLERIAIQKAKQRKKKTIAFIDHWVNYEERFILQGSFELPDEIWVGDEFAKRLATLLFSNTLVIQKTNPYFEELRRYFESRVTEKHLEGVVLYVCEPIREHALMQHNDEFFWGYSEEQALEFFLKNTSSLNLAINEIRIRPHPSEKYDKYKWAIQMGVNKTVIAAESLLVDDILAADVVVGCESMAMVVALLAGKRVVSSIPPGGKPCALPHHEIEHLLNLLHNSK